MDRPDTPLLRLAEERGWRVPYFDDDGTGCAAIAPGVTLEIERRWAHDTDLRYAEEGFEEARFSVSISFESKTSAPPTLAELQATIPSALERAAARLRGKVAGRA